MVVVKGYQLKIMPSD